MNAIDTDNINDLNFLSVMLISPAIKLGDISANTELIVEQIKINSSKSNLIIFPELCLTGATCLDYFFCDDLSNQIKPAIDIIVKATLDFDSTVVIGTPFQIDNKLINCALFISQGKLLGIVPKQINTRWFSISTASSTLFNDYEVQIAENLLFSGSCRLGICVGELNIAKLDKLSEAEIIINIEAVPYLFQADEIKKNALINLSKLSKNAILYVNTNANESTTDFIFGGMRGVFECGKQILNKSKFMHSDDQSLSFKTQTYSTEIDLDIIRGHRKNNTAQHYQFTSQTTLNNHHNTPNNINNTLNNHHSTHNIQFRFPKKNLTHINRYCAYKLRSDNLIETTNLKNYYADPFLTAQIASSTSAMDIINMQAYALAKRMAHTKQNSLVLGISGGIDSTLALLVCVRCFDILNLDKKNIYALSMPGLGTSDNTNYISETLATSLNVTFRTISISDAVKLHFKDLNHSETDKNTLYENAQARFRALLLFDFANKCDGLVVGTGDLSEIALGWSTYAGDHISSYNVNAGIPKTVAQAILRYISCDNEYFKTLDHLIIEAILSKPISPELLPPDAAGKIQNTEEIIGRYILHDFFMFYYLSFGLSKSKIRFIARYAFINKSDDDLNNKDNHLNNDFNMINKSSNDLKKNSYDFQNCSEDEINRCLDIFYARFALYQYKRTCAPDGPSIYPISLSPRAGLHFPSDFTIQ